MYLFTQRYGNTGLGKTSHPWFMAALFTRAKQGRPSVSGGAQVDGANAVNTYNGTLFGLKNTGAAAVRSADGP